MANMFRNMSALRTLVLGENFLVTSDNPSLPNVSNSSATGYNGLWGNADTGEAFSSLDLMQQYRINPRNATWTWQRG